MKYFCLYNGASENLYSFKVDRTAGRAVDNAVIEVARTKTVNLNDTVYITISPIDLTGLKGLIHLDGDVKDWTANANHGTATNVTYSDGIHEKWAVFNGTSSKIAFAHHTANNFGTSDFTIFWECNFTSTTLMPIIDKYGNSGWSITVENGKIKIYVKKSDGTQYTYTSTYTINDGAWHHCAVSRKYGTRWKIIVDGVVRDTITDNNVLPNDIDHNINTTMHVGHSPVLGNYYNSTLDEIFWFTREVEDFEHSDEGEELDHLVTIFGGVVIDREYKYDRISVTCEGFGRVVRDKFVEAKKYYNQTIEAIIEDLIETAGTGDVNQGTGFTYDSTWSSGITLKEFVAFGQMVDIITELARSVGVDFHVTYNKLFHFEPNINEIIDWEAENGVNVKANGWTIKDSEIVNIVYLLGGAKKYTTSETFVSTSGQTDFVLDYAPISVEVFVDPAGGTNYTRKVPDIDYTIDREGKTIKFAAGQALNASVKIDYEYDLPIFLKTQDLVSISQYGERARKFNADWVVNIDDARRYANGLLAYYKQPRLMGKITHAGLKANIFEMSVIRVIDDYATPIVDQTMDVKSITWKYPEGVTEFEVGTWTPRVFEWQKEIMLRIRDLERRAAVITELRRFLQLQETFTLTDAVVTTPYSSGQFRIAGGAALHLQLEQNGNDSGYGNHSVAVGSSITYVTGKRKYGANFPADSNSVITVTDASDIRVQAQFSIHTTIKPDLITQDATVNRRIIGKSDDANNAYVILIRGDAGHEGKLFFSVKRAGVVTSVETAAGTIAAGTEYDITCKYDNGTGSIYINGAPVSVTSAVTPTYTTAPNLIIGRHDSSSGRYDGWQDEVMYIAKAVSDTEASNLYVYGDTFQQPARIGKFDTNP